MVKRCIESPLYGIHLTSKKISLSITRAQAKIQSKELSHIFTTTPRHPIHILAVSFHI